MEPLTAHQCTDLAWLSAGLCLAQYLLFVLGRKTAAFGTFWHFGLRHGNRECVCIHGSDSRPALYSKLHPGRCLTNIGTEGFQCWGRCAPPACGVATPD